MLAVPAAQAAELWVDDGGTDGGGFNGCASQGFACGTLAHTISVASGNADPTDTIHVGGGSYPQAVTLPPGISLLKDAWNFGTIGSATVDGGTLPAVTVSVGLPTRSISGDFILRGNDDGTPSQASVLLSPGANPGNVTISGATFNETGIPHQLLINGGSPQILGNTFTGVDDNMLRNAITYQGDATPEFGGNTITTFFNGIHVSDTAAMGKPAPNAHDNTITDIYDDGMMLAIASGIYVNEGSGQFTDNLIRAKAGQDFTNGISVTAAAPTGTPLTLARNEIYDLPSTSNGVDITTGDPASLSSDVIANTGVGISLISSTGGVTATGLTVTDSTSPVNREIHVQNTALTLNSSIVGAQGVTLAGGGTCMSTFSRGPTAPGNCGFATAANPMFADPAMDDFHLQAGSPMIEMGDPNSSAGTDLDGDPRALDAIFDCVVAPRRDIGADEFAGVTQGVPVSCNPAVPAVTPPPTTSPATRKKCKKGRKLRKGKCVKKKRRKN